MTRLVLDRRSFLVALAAAGCTRPPDWACEEEVFSLVEGLPLEAAVVGERYVEQRPGFVDRAELVAELEAIEDLGARVRLDFAEERVVDVDGWRLSLTEARLAALLYLSGLCP